MKLKLDYGGRKYSVQINRAWHDGFGAEDIDFDLFDVKKKVIIEGELKAEIGMYVRQLLGISNEEQD